MDGQRLNKRGVTTTCSLLDNWPTQTFCAVVFFSFIFSYHYSLTTDTPISYFFCYIYFLTFGTGGGSNIIRKGWMRDRITNVQRLNKRQDNECSKAEREERWWMGGDGKKRWQRRDDIWSKVKTEEVMNWLKLKQEGS